MKLSRAEKFYPPGPWDVSEKEYPSGGTFAEKMRFFLRYAILAPSTHNTQPWIFKLGKDFVELYADRKRSLPVADPDNREMVISCGAALFNLITVARRFGYLEDVKAFPGPLNPDLLARLSIYGNNETTGEEYLLFKAITQRHTNRMPYNSTQLPGPLVESLIRSAYVQGAWLQVIELEDEREAVAELVAEGDRIQGSDRAFRQELSSWVHPNRSRDKDGIPGYAFGIGNIASYAGPVITRAFDWGKGQAAKDSELAKNAPFLAVLGTDKDTPQDWLNAGQALERVLLRAAGDGVSASYLNQPVEVRSLRPRLGSIVKKRYPQMLLRMGYGPDVRPTPRRELEEVLNQEGGI